MTENRIKSGRPENRVQIPYCSNRSKLFRRVACKLLIFGAGDGTRTRDVQLGKLAFYH
jgi:hypothetical protein